MVYVTTKPIDKELLGDPYGAIYAKPFGLHSIIVIATCQYLLNYQVLIHKEVTLCHWEHSKLNIFIFMSSLVLSPHSHHFSAAHDDKINNCGFKFSMACNWHVLIKENNDNLLKFAKVFPTKFLKLPIRQSFPHQHFELHIRCL